VPKIRFSTSEFRGGVCPESARWVFTVLSRRRPAIVGPSKIGSPKSASGFDYFRSCAGSRVASVAAHHARAAATAILNNTGTPLSWRVQLILWRITHCSPSSPYQNLNHSVPGDVPTDAFSRTPTGIKFRRSSGNWLWFWFMEIPRSRYRRWRRSLSRRKRINYATGASAAEAQAGKAATDERRSDGSGAA